VPATGPGRIDVISPSTEEQVGSVPDGTEADMDAAVAAARRTFDDPTGWSSWSREDRAEVLERLADALEARGQETAHRVSMQNGMPITIARPRPRRCLEPPCSITDRRVISGPGCSHLGLATRRLGGTVWTSDTEHGTDVARRIQTGTIGVNQYLPDPAAPFGGVKASGLGRELGPEGLAANQQLQSIYLAGPTEA
jgi:acyl-CoA reductase-like NAD-dependent aldehyde dehydrogenase